MLFSMISNLRDDNKNGDVLVIRLHDVDYTLIIERGCTLNFSIRSYRYSSLFCVRNSESTKMFHTVPGTVFQRTCTLSLIVPVLVMAVLKFGVEKNVPYFKIILKKVGIPK